MPVVSSVGFLLRTDLEPGIINSDINSILFNTEKTLKETPFLHTVLSLSTMDSTPSYDPIWTVTAMVTTASLTNATIIGTRTGDDHQLNATAIAAFRQELSDQMAIVLLPAILLLGFLMVVGCVGNSLVFYVYLTKFNPSSTRTAILALASFDLVASCISMPGEIIDIRYSYNFQSGVICKCFRLCTVMVLIASGLTLVVVAVDRYRRICRPLNDQMTAGQTKIWVAASLLGAVVFSIPSPIIYGLSRVHTHVEGLYGVECSIDYKYKKHPLPFVYNCMFAVLFLAVFSGLTILYILLGRQVLKQTQFRRSVKRTFVQEDHSITDGTRDTSRQTEGVPTSPVPDVVQLASISISPKFSDDDELAAKPRRSSPPRKMSTMLSLRQISLGDRRTRKTTMMLFILTATFVISFLPHLILKGIQAVNKDFLDNASDAEIVLYNIFVRSYFFNSVANCFIYGFCSPKFRRECKKIFIQICFCFGKRK